MSKLKKIWSNRWVKFGVVSLLYTLWFVVWTGNPWLLPGIAVIYDIYISKYMYRLFWRKHKERKQTNRTYRKVSEWVEAIVFATVVATLIRIYVFAMFVIPTPSMEKSLLVGDYLLSTALLRVARTQNVTIVKYLSELGRTLASGEILQLSNIQNQEISEDVYYQVIRQKTAALFEACCTMGALSAGASDEEIGEAARFGRNLGIIFQIRDDIFDYYDSPEIGKPTGNDMAEGKLTLPVIYAVNSSGSEVIRNLARKVKDRTVSADEIAVLVDYTKTHGGIEYAERRMNDFRLEAMEYLDNHVADDGIRDALGAYLDYVIERMK